MHKTLFIAFAAAAVAAHAANGEVKLKGGEAQFRMMDTNKDGQISPEEHAAGARWMFDVMDADKDGKVTAAEMDAAHDARTPQRKTELTSAQKIKVVDTDGDGALSAEEHMKGARTMFERMDTDKSGSLSPAELQAGHKKMLEKAR